MSRYGIDFYGTVPYGATQLVNFDASPFKATPNDHRSIFLTWSNPVGNWTRIRLVRSTYGYPVNESDGTVLFDLNAGPSATGTVVPGVTNYLDPLLAPGRLYYYTLFVYGLAAYNGRDDWRRAGNVTGLSVQDWGYTNKLVNQLPGFLTTDLANVGAANGDSDTSIYRYMSLPGFQLDYTRSQYETLLSVNDPSNVAGGLLPLLANQFGLQYEPEVGMEQLRVLLRNIVHIYKFKGTKTGIEALAEAFTGWGATSGTGVNLMLDYNDSSFEESLGRWVNVTNTTLTRYPADGTIAAFSTGTNKIAGLAKLSSVAAGSMTVRFGAVSPVLYGVPVNGGQQYVASLYSRAGALARAVSVQIDWYSEYGAVLSSSVGSTVNNATGAWTARPFVTAAAPPLAAYAGLTVVVAATAAGAELHYLDGVQFEAGSVPSTFQEARDVRLVLNASRVNEATNPSFEVSTAGWTAPGSTVISRATSPFLYGAASMQVVTDGAASAPYIVMPLISGLFTYTVSAWIYGPAGLYRIGHAQSLPNVGTNSTLGPQVNVPANTWTQVGATFTLTATETAAQWNIVGPGSSTFFVDGVLVERGTVMGTYFDGATGVTHPADYIWEGTTGLSRTHYYQNRTAKTFRLSTLITDYLWAGMTFTMLVAQPGT